VRLRLGWVVRGTSYSAMGVAVVGRVSMAGTRVWELEDDIDR